MAGKKNFELSQDLTERCLFVINYLHKNSFKKSSTVNNFLRTYLNFFKDDKFTIPNSILHNLECKNLIKSYKFGKKKHYLPVRAWDKKKLQSVMKKFESTGILKNGDLNG